MHRDPHVVTIPMTAPRNFSFVRNPDQISALLSKIRGIAKTGRKIRMNMQGVEEMTSDGIAVFTSQIARQSEIEIRGNAPLDPALADMFTRSGFYSYVRSRRTSEESDQGLIQRKDSHIVEPETADALIQFARKQTGLTLDKAGYRTLIECMSNTNQHAADLHQEHESWWTTVHCPKGSDRACFTFTDWGIGIIDSLEIKGLKRLLKGDDPRILRSLLDGDIASRTGQPFRGKGLPRLKLDADQGLLENVVIVSNRAHADVSKGEYRIIGTPFRGTFIYWEQTH